MAWNVWRPTVRVAWLFAVALILPRPISAATLTVTDLGDTGAPGQLRTLINSAAPGDTIVIPAGTITLRGPAGEHNNAGGDLDIAKDLTVQGTGAGLTIIDGGGIDRVFNFISQLPFVRVAISNLTIRNGVTASHGGGLLNELGNTVVLTNVTIAANSSTSSGGTGGGIYKHQGTMSLTNVTIRNNRAFRGGGIENEFELLQLTNVTVSGNTSDFGIGGGITNFGTVTLTNVTISDNTGEGVTQVGSGSTATLTNVTVSGNRGGILNSGTVTLTNVLLASNTAGGGGDTCLGIITSRGHNLDSGSTCSFSGPGDLSNTDPKLGPLANNGGPTQTHALLPGSPAIDAGTNTGCPATDQRGVPRPQGAACDIGAYEAVAFNIAEASAFVTRLYEQVLNREPDPAGLQRFVDQIAQFGSVVPTVLAFFHSQEFLGRNTTNEQVLTICYHTFLNRDPDPNGFNAFLTALQAGQLTRDNLLDIFLDS
jgi:uncharacterized protein (UPF0333 family)